VTTRKSFIVATGFAVVSLYFLWAAYGAVPLNLVSSVDAASADARAQVAAIGPRANMANMAFVKRIRDAEPEGGGMAGMQMSGDNSAIDDFLVLSNAFVDRYEQDDGSVRPTVPGPGEAALGGRRDEAEPVAEVILTGFQWGYDPSVIRLDANQPYRFRMMALDATHGASISAGGGSRIIRLPKGVENVQTLTFTKPGKYMIYCTVYCGVGHDLMQAQIIVTA
jgi:heme/copper-type cytochrome/quinol oxidase subunit 2